MKCTFHTHQLMKNVTDGSFEFSINNKTENEEIGDSIFILANTIHEVNVLEAGFLVDVSAP